MGKNFKYKMHIKAGDTVQITCGRYKGEISEILKVFPKTSTVIVKNINIKTKHARPKQEGENGKIIHYEAPIHSSNVMIYSKKHKRRSRFYIEYNDNKKHRKLRKTGEII